MIGTLDRYLLKRSCAAMLLIMTLALLLGVFFDLVLNMELYMSAELPEDTHRWLLVTELYVYRLPLIAIGILPFVVVAGALTALGPMLKRGDWTAVVAGGLSPQRISASLCVLALLAGTVHVCCNNIINPQLHNHIQGIEELFSNAKHSSRVWHIKSTQSTWYASRSRMPKDEAPSFESIFIAPPHNGSVFAAAMDWNGSAWVLHPPIVRWINNENGEQIKQEQSLALTGAFAMPLSPDELRQELLTREAFTGFELWERGDHMYITLLLNRCLALFVPLLALLYALPSFMRFANQSRILVAASKALLLASVPVAIIALTGMAADASNWSPWLSNGIGLVCAAVPGCLFYRRWTA